MGKKKKDEYNLLSIELCLLFKIPFIKGVSLHYDRRNMYSDMFLIATGSLLKIVAAEC